MKTEIIYKRHKSGSNGKCVWGLFQNTIWIDPDYRLDKGLLAHEKYHARGSWLDCFIRRTKYSLSDKFRYKEEVEAYAEQFMAYDYDPELYVFVKYIRTGYDLPSKLTVLASSDLLREIKKRVLGNS